MSLLAKYAGRYGKLHRYARLPASPSALVAPASPSALVAASLGALAAASPGALAPAQRVWGESRALPAIDSLARQLAMRPRALPKGSGKLRPSHADVLIRLANKK